MIYFIVALLGLISIAFYFLRRWLENQTIKHKRLIDLNAELNRKNVDLIADNQEYLEKIKSLDETIGSLNKELTK